MGESIRILLVDDDDVDREAIQRAFGESQISNPILCASNGVEALEMIRGTEGKPALPRPYIVLLDLNMPRMNGIEFLTEIRSDPALCDTLVMVLSTSGADKDRVAAYGLNVAGYITKSKAGEDFSRLVKLLEVYWRLIELPV